MDRPTSQHVPKLDYGGGKPPGDKGGRNSGGGGDNNDNNNDGSGNSKHKPMNPEEKYILSSMFANYAMKKILKGDEFLSHHSSPLTQIANIEMVRKIMNDNYHPYKQAWDLKLRRLYFYK